jgi:hypothetical protein
MSDSPKILLQLDTDTHASSFDAVVATDAGVDRLFQYAGVSAENVVPLIHGAMFTRGGKNLANTAIFLGGSDVAAAEETLERVCKTFFGPVRVSVMFDANGCNTTAAAAVVSAARHLDLSGATALVLGGTGPVGMRVARLLAASGCEVRLASRDRARAQKAIHHVGEHVDHRLLVPACTDTADALAASLDGTQILFGCGAAGVQLIDRGTLESASSVRVAIDLNAVPPAGIEGIEATDKAKKIGDMTCYGAIGVGGLKMKIHRRAVQQLFESHESVLDADEIFQIGRQLDA